jgi:hypothetical protein
MVQGQLTLGSEFKSQYKKINKGERFVAPSKEIYFIQCLQSVELADFCCSVPSYEVNKTLIEWLLFIVLCSVPGTVLGFLPTVSYLIQRKLSLR